MRTWQNIKVFLTGIQYIIPLTGEVTGEAGNIPQNYEAMQSTSLEEYLPNSLMTEHFSYHNFPAPGQSHLINVAEVYAEPTSHTLEMTSNPIQENVE